MSKVTQKRLRPSRPGLIVRDPRTKKTLKAGGEFKPYDSYWYRRLLGGDVVECAKKRPIENKPRPEHKKTEG